MSKRYKLMVSNSNEEVLFKKNLKEDSFEAAMLKSQKILKQNTMLRNKFTSDIEVTLTNEKKNGNVTYKMMWEKPIFSTGYKTSKGWQQYIKGVPFTGDKKHTKKVMEIGSWVFIIVISLLAFITIYSIHKNNTTDVAIFSALIFVISLILNFIAPFAKDTLNSSAKSASEIKYHTRLTSFPAWVIIAVTALTIYNTDLITNIITPRKLHITSIVVTILIIISVRLKLSFDYKNDIKEQLEKDIFTIVEKSSIPKESLVKEIEKPISTEIKSSTWTSRHISLHFFLLSLILLKYFFFKKSEKE